MNSVIETFTMLLSLCVTAALIWYAIRLLKAHTELAETRIEKLRKEMDLLEEQKQNSR